MLFVDADDLWRGFRPAYERRLLSDDVRRRGREGRLSVSEVMTILIASPTSNFRTFRRLYLFLRTHHRQDFPGLVGYVRFTCGAGSSATRVTSTRIYSNSGTSAASA